MNNNNTRKGFSIENTLLRISSGRKMPKSLFVVLLFLYAGATVLTLQMAFGNGTITLFDNTLPMSIFAGVFTSMGNMCLIVLVILYKKTGFITALILLACQFPSISISFFVRRNPNSLPGLFMNLLTIITIIVIYFSNAKIERFQQRIQEQAVTDMLTGLPNRFASTELMMELSGHNEKFVLATFDLNNFKSINETMGHEAGNQVLKEIARRWKALADSEQTGTIDFIARLGGDEFLLIIRKYPLAEDALETIKLYKKELEKMLTIDNCDCYINARVGFAEYPVDADTVDQLFSGTAAALDECKHSPGDNGILHFTPEKFCLEQTLEIERKIHKALENDTILFHLQPQYDMDHKLRGFEALARMKDDNGALISPAKFIPVAEKTGLVDQLDICVFRKAAAFLSEFILKNQLDIILSINVSVRHLMKNNFIKEIQDIIQSTGIPVKNLEIEITESIMIDSADEALQRIEAIKKMGIRIAIDDFGTGYSSLSYLNHFPADMLKIDKSFIDVMNTSESNKQYVATIISIGHILHLDVISEGVESGDQLETLRNVGCDYIQGFVWGRPLPPEEARCLITG